MMTKKLEDGSISYTGYCIDLLNELKRNLKFTYDIYSAPEGKYGIETENGTWNGMIGELLSEVSKLIVCFVVGLLNVLSPATHHLNIPSGKRWGEGGLPPYTGSIGMCNPKGYGFSAVLVSIFAFFVIIRVWIIIMIVIIIINLLSPISMCICSQ